MKVKIKIPAAAKTPKIEHSALPAKKVPATGRIGGGEPFIDIEDISDDEEQETRPKSAATPAPVLPTFAVPAPIPPRKQIRKFGKPRPIQSSFPNDSLPHSP